MKTIPDAVLNQHMAVLGKTGSGKTSTEKLAVEQVVDAGYRVCVLDPVKSDWWGITSSADGKRPGLPFKILGGPRGHIPLHSSAGGVIGHLVGSGKLPLSIIDMADFEAGGLQRFFNDFAPALMRHARGVVYLVIEEAHEFAPKERSGIGAENMAIHWAKKLATAGRSKGIRLIVATQRTQALHNAVLGSCETIIAHRLSTPADQAPVIKWLKANTDKTTEEKVASSLSSLPTGTAWVCSGEARIFEEIKFSKFRTFDNTATPTRDGAETEVKTAPVDQDELRALIGDAVKEAEANDPKKLKAEIAKLRKDLSARNLQAPSDPKALAVAELRGWERGKRDAIVALRQLSRDAETASKHIASGADAVRKLMESVAAISSTPVVSQPLPPSRAAASTYRPAPLGLDATSVICPISRPQQRILDAVLWLEEVGVAPASKEATAFLAGASSTSGGYFNNLSSLRTAGHIEYPQGGFLALTNTGRLVANPPDRPGSLKELHEAVRSKLQPSLVKVLNGAIDAYPGQVDKADLATRIEVSATSGGYFNNLSRLRTLGLIDYPTKGCVRASDILFPEGLQ